MATLSPAARSRRVFEFLLGLRDDRVAQLLLAHGFGVPERELGWELLKALGMTQSVPVTTACDRTAETALDGWRKQWLPIARASLEQSHPKAFSRLFHDLDNKDKNPMNFLMAFLVRYEKLASAKDSVSRDAMAKLKSRGLTRERIAEMQALFERFKQPVHVELVDCDQRRAAIRRAEDALWNYYREWSQIARAAIKDVRLLKLLGYRDDQSPDDASDETAIAPNLNESVKVVTGSEALKKKRRTTKSRR